MTTQEEVITWIIKCVGNEYCLPQEHSSDNRGTDLKLNLHGSLYYIEAIAFNKKNRGKNQSDFWKAFAQAISRLNNQNSHKPDKIVIALPYDFRKGWISRINIHGKDIWCRIGNAFPELEIWFVSDDKLEPYSWNNAFIEEEKCEKLT